MNLYEIIDAFLDATAAGNIRYAGGVYCRECAFGEPHSAAEGQIYCRRTHTRMRPEDFCSRGEAQCESVDVQ